MITAMTYLFIILVIATAMVVKTVNLLFHDGRGPASPMVRTARGSHNRAGQAAAEPSTARSPMPMLPEADGERPMVCCPKARRTAAGSGSLSDEARSDQAGAR